jgi:lysophospholipase L1-like esterase
MPFKGRQMFLPKIVMRTILCLAGSAIFAFLPVSSAATEGTHWVGTWAASMTLMQPPPRSGLASSYSNVTLRDVVHTSLGGKALRLTLSNEFGAAPLLIAGVHVAISDGGSKIDAASDHAVMFGGQSSITIPAGTVAVSDAVEMSTPAFANLAVSIYLPEGGTADHLSYHSFASSSNYIADGDALSASALQAAQRITSWMLLAEIDVDTPSNAAAVITLGDSITDGVHSTLDKNDRWPDVLAARLKTNKKTSEIGVLNAGISGNRLLTDGLIWVGPNALARFDRDVLALSGAKYLIVLEGINDIGQTAKPLNPDDMVDTPQLIWGLQQLVIRAHAHGIKVYGATLTPYVGASYQNAHGEEMREALNNWIRTSGVFDAVLDFDKVVRDPAHPDTFLAKYNSGDHLHPNDAGYKAMADAIDLSLFQKHRKDQAANNER